MLKISGPGWATISIDGKDVFEGSYLTDIPCDFLRALYDCFYYSEEDSRNNRTSSSVFVDAEGAVANFVFCENMRLDAGKTVFMFYGREDDFRIETFEAEPYELAVELIHDIENDFENWVRFGPGDTKNELKIARDNLMYWLEKLKAVIANEKPYAEKFKEWNTPGTPENNKIQQTLKLAIEKLENNENALPSEHLEKHLPEKNKRK